MAGLFRIRCLNSLVAQIATIDSIKVRHSGDALEKVVDETYRVLGQAEAVLAAPRDWSRIALDEDARAALGRERACAALRRRRPLGSRRRSGREQLLTPRRADDRAKTFGRDECRSGERHARRPVGARASDDGPAWTLATRPRGDDARDQQHRPGRRAQQGAVGSRRRMASSLDAPHSSAPPSQQRDDACDRKPEHQKTAWDPTR